MEPTLQEIEQMRNGDQALVEKYLLCMLDVIQADIASRPYAEAAARWEAFKDKLQFQKQQRTFMIDGSGI